ncbi:MAG: type II toxin-antitoxin system HicB family antitoxin [Clostridia bacterium]|nr:type II toxin-antitoxin system HicB family antitoxin [Clostridia bacterium]MBO5257934.1 type II toxin-antitoxin system HicB family antitoxin [Clostridia bacterium]MBP3293693.1 type II toxin-antitoxin system HicB family antitoxin [Clostridia bacterium]
MKKKDRYVYPAVLTYEEGYEIAVTFPDLPGCATSGETEADALTMGKEALGLHLWGMETDGDEIPSPSKLKDIETEENEVIVLIEVFMPAVRLAQENRSVSRTVTLPAWLNAAALERNINFSETLQKALKEMIQA